MKKFQKSNYHNNNTIPITKSVSVHYECNGKGILVYVRDYIPSKLLNTSYVSSDTECLAIKVNLNKTKWLQMYSNNRHKNNISNHLMIHSETIDRNLSC